MIITNQADVGLYTNVSISAVKFVGTGETGAFITVRAPAAGLTFPANWVISNFTLNAALRRAQGTASGDSDGG